MSTHPNDDAGPPPGSQGSTRPGTTPSVGWAAFVAAEPGLAEVAERRFGAFKHHVLVTLRKDGSPRTSGLEVLFRGGEL